MTVIHYLGHPRLMVSYHRRLTSAENPVIVRVQRKDKNWYALCSLRNSVDIYTSTHQLVMGESNIHKGSRMAAAMADSLVDQLRSLTPHLQKVG